MDLDSNDHSSDLLAHNVADNYANSLPTGESEKDDCEIQFYEVDEELDDIEMNEENVIEIMDEVIKSNYEPKTLENLANTSFVKRKAAEVLDTAVTVPNKNRKAILTTNNSNQNDLPPIMDCFYMEEAIIIPDILMSIENGTKKAAGLAKIMQIGMKYNQ